MSSPSEPLVVPVGHLLGTFYRRPDVQARRVTVQLGGDLHDLDDDEFAIWWLAHSLPDRPVRPWTAAAVSETADQIGLPAAAPVLDRLVRRGLVVELRTGEPAAVEFARAVRVVPLMLGLGNSPETPEHYQIGLFGRPVIHLPHPLYDLWRWAGVEAHLWNACRAGADVASRAGAADPDETDPEQLLDVFLEALHPLLAAQAMYLDRRRGTSSGVPDGAADG